MAEDKHFLAIDFGAESGRGIIVTLSSGKVSMKEINRWPNRPVRLNGTLYWDFPYLFAEMLEAMKHCASRGVKISSIGVDTWGVDFGLLRDGQLLANPVSYRDHRTDGIHEFTDKTMSRDDIFSETGYEPWAISSLFQLTSLKRDGSGLLDMADGFLNMPDLFNFFLTSRMASERSIANTSNLMATDGEWSRRIIEKFELPDMFQEMIEPATVLGTLQPEIAEATGLDAVPVVAVCGHDTSAALAAVPAAGENWAFLSCGTWSILGCLVDQPVATPECLAKGYTNEYTLGGWYLARNILGLWLVQELRRKWDTPADLWDYPRMTKEASQAEGFAGLVNVADESLMAPADMEEALVAVLEKAGQGRPETRGQLIRSVLESLALEYAHGMGVIAELTGKPKDALYLVGGGIANKLLCQFTADACGMEVWAGADQCTAMGNGLIQAKGLGLLAENNEIREVMRNSVEIVAYHPTKAEAWAEKRRQYKEIRG